MSDTREIRFLDNKKNELFRVPDGGYIRVSIRHSEREMVSQCWYVDPDHLRFDDNDYNLHIEFVAARAAFFGLAARPEPNPETVNGYFLTHYEPVGNQIFVIGYNPSEPQPYVTWQRHKDNKDYCYGHYFKDYAAANADFKSRVKSERADLPQKTPAEKKKEVQER